jgi:ribonuclease HI
VLQTAEGAETLRAAESETAANGERLELLSVVRGLEALPSPSRVTLVTASDYVRRGIRDGIEEWRENGWQWERFGEMVPVKNLDLWRRIDRALGYHDVELKRWRVDAAHMPNIDVEEEPSPKRAALNIPAKNSAANNSIPPPKRKSLFSRAAEPVIEDDFSTDEENIDNELADDFADENWNEETWSDELETVSANTRLNKNRDDELDDSFPQRSSKTKSRVTSQLRARFESKRFATQNEDEEFASDDPYYENGAQSATRRSNRNIFLSLKRNLRISILRIVARVRELSESVAWCVQQVGSPLLARPWDDFRESFVNSRADSRD